MKLLIRASAVSLMVSLALLTAPGKGLADIPQKISYQGRLTTASGSAVSGSQSILFSLFDASSSGTELWNETQTVTVTNGLYNVSLGSVVPISTAVVSGGAAWLQIKVGSDSAMTPRVRFLSTPFSLLAQMANSLNSLMPITEFLSFVPVNASVASGSGYTVASGKNLIIVNIDPQGDCGIVFGTHKCHVSVSGAHSGTTIAGLFRHTNAAIAGPGDVIASTGAVLTHKIRGFLTPATVTVVLQDLAASGSFTVPAGKTLFFGIHGTNTSCAGNFSINGFLTSESSTGGMLNAGESVTNSKACIATLNGYLK